MYDIKVEQIEKSEKENNGTFLQTPFWCQFKARHGWSYRRFAITYVLKASDHLDEEEYKGCSHNESEKDLTKTFEMAVLNRSFAKGLFSIAYVPLMPQLPFECTPDEVVEKLLDSEDRESVCSDELQSASTATNTAVVAPKLVTPETQTIEFGALLNELTKALKPYLPSNTIAVRYDPEIAFSRMEDRDNFNLGLKLVAFADKLKLKKSRVDIQPPDSTLVDLTGTEEEILGRMHQKWRYNIRLSERKGVVIHRYLGNNISLSEKVDKFYELTKETNARDGNSSHAKSYYLDLIQSSAKEIAEGKDVPVVSLYIAEHEGDEIAAIMTLFSHDQAIYLYGASSNNKRNLMPNHLLQWTAMKDAKAYGSKVYDMYGMPPEGKDENHPMHGLYMFKANFGGKIIHRTGSWDCPLKAVYYLYTFAEKLRAFWYKKVIKKLKGR